MSSRETRQASAPPESNRAENGLTPEEKKEIYGRALARARRKMALYVHAAAYASVMLLLLAVNLFTTPRSLWVIWPILGWGAGLLFHWVRVMKPVRVYENLKTKEIARELERRA